MKMVRISAKQKVAVTGVSGVAAGLALSTLAAEFTSKATGQTGWAACGVKAGVKGLIGAMAYLVSGRVGESTAMFAEMFAYTSWGSIVMDVIMAAYPGGIPGLAEEMASMVRVAAVGGRRTVRELGMIESGVGTPGQVVGWT